MRHLKDHRKLGRTASHRKAMFRNMVTSIIQYERIETTLPKAKELRRYADRMITLGKKGTLHARRHALRYVQDPKAVQKLFAELATRFQDRAGGYTRIYHIGYRQGDNAPMAIIEYLGAPLRQPKKVKESAEASGAKKPAKKAKKSLLGTKKADAEKKKAKKKEEKPKKAKAKAASKDDGAKKVKETKATAKASDAKKAKESTDKKPKKTSLLQKIRGKKKAAKKS